MKKNGGKKGWDSEIFGFGNSSLQRKIEILNLYF
jgi:hypothetical protein